MTDSLTHRRSRRRRASLTLYGSPLGLSHAGVSKDRRTDMAHASSPHVPPVSGTPDEHSADEADPLLLAIARVQAEARRDATLLALLPLEELDRVMESTVRELWLTSQIKTFVPVLALRQARETLLAESVAHESVAGANRERATR